MLAQLGARLAAVGSVVERLYVIRFRTSAGVAVAALMLGGCMPTTVPLAGADPADRNARVAAVGHPSTVAPYKPLAPTRHSPPTATAQLLLPTTAFAPPRRCRGASRTTASPRRRSPASRSDRCTGTPPKS